MYRPEKGVVISMAKQPDVSEVSPSRHKNSTKNSSTLVSSKASEDGLYILLVSIHGLIRGDKLELGRDSDTGGQTLYVVELAKALSKHPNVAHVDLLTRLVNAPNIDDDYAQPIEQVNKKFRIVRIEDGAEGYIRKEELWDHLDNLTDNAAEFLRNQERLPDLIHSHYADAGYVGTQLSRLFGRPQVHTGHSLGRVKRMRLLANGSDKHDVEVRYAMSRRINAEEETLSNAELVVVSTANEISEQYEMYDCYHPEGMTIIPPGVNLTRFHPPNGNELNTRLAHNLGRFLKDISKPMVLAIARPDERKNLPALVTAFGEEPQLRKLANLVIVPGTREDISEMDNGPQDVLKELLITIDRYDLYGHAAMPKDMTDVPFMYRLAAATEGVFVNPALTEPFGLTLLEAAASGLPLVATHDGGPTDILENCQNGHLIDPLDTEDISDALLAILKNKKAWQRMHNNGLTKVAQHYSWKAHTENYIEQIIPLVGREKSQREAVRRPSIYADRALIADLDQALIGDQEHLDILSRMIRENRKTTAFGIATGRPLDSALRLIRRHGIPAPDILITGLGSEIHYGRRLLQDGRWTSHIDYQWNPRAVRRVLADVEGITLQPRDLQTPYKVSYYYDADEAPTLEELQVLFYQAELNVNVSIAFGQFLDILPSRASKGLALRYAAHHMEIPLERILVAGGSASDEDMMRGNTMAVIVADRHDDELSDLAELNLVLQTEAKHAAGILEAIEACDFFGGCAFPTQYDHFEADADYKTAKEELNINDVVDVSDADMV